MHETKCYVLFIKFTKAFVWQNIKVLINVVLDNTETFVRARKVYSIGLLFNIRKRLLKFHQYPWQGDQVLSLLVSEELEIRETYELQYWDDIEWYLKINWSGKKFELLYILSLLANHL